MRACAIAMVLAGLAAPAAAMDDGNNFWVIGFGSVPCREYASGTDERKLGMETWAAGYITAMNRATPDTYNLLTISVEEAKTRLEKRCKDDPEQLFTHAVHNLLESLYDGRTQRMPK